MPRPRLFATLFVLLLILVPFHRSLLFGETFVPADLLSYLSPWKAVPPPAPTPFAGDGDRGGAPAWNVLRFDGVAQFYPWRLQAARAVRAGQIPYWNPYQFAASGGTPLLANSQSAPLYPLHALFYLVAPERIGYMFGLVAAIHLAIAASGLYVLLRACGLRRGACAVGAAAWSLCAPVICWLSLPSFLGVMCWLPWLLLLLRVAHTHAGTRTGRLAVLGAGGVTGMSILAGHLQIALYVLLVAGLYGVWLGVSAIRQKSVSPSRWLGAAVLTVALGLCLSAPQVLPTLELSRVSSRAVTEKTGELFDANNATALPFRALVTLLAPDFFGHPNQGLHWNNSNVRDAAGHFGNNYAEWAMYVGVLPLLLAVFALVSSPMRGDKGFFALVALFALLIATGTPLNRLLFYAVPGYASLANPARVLGIWAFAVAALSAWGAQTLLDAAVAPAAKTRGAAIALAVLLLVAAVGASGAARWAGDAVAQVPFADLIAQATPGLMIAGLVLVLSAALLFAAPRMVAKKPAASVALLAAMVLLTVADLALWGYGYNPSAKPERVYPVTPGIAWLQRNAPRERIAVINRDWTLGETAPRFAALPPNALTVYGLHDVAGYDSLFPKSSKELVRTAGGGQEPSPDANGNIVFVKQLQTARNLGARYIVLAGDSPMDTTGFGEAYRGNDLLILDNGSGEPLLAAPPIPASLRIGVGLATIAGLLLVGGVAVQNRAKS